MEATFMRLATEGSNAKQIAETAVARWCELDAVLSPIIGQRGVSALYKRALYLIRSDYPWLMAAHSGDSPFGDFAPLQNALAQQTNVEASAANFALYTSFHSILISLIGESLTGRLLQSILDTSSSGVAVQDPSS